MPEEWALPDLPDLREDCALADLPDLREEPVLTELRELCEELAEHDLLDESARLDECVVRELDEE